MLEVRRHEETSDRPTAAKPYAGTPEEYAANIMREEGKWAALVKKLGLKIE